MAKIAIIGGTGVYNPRMLNQLQQKSIETPFGEVTYTSGIYADQEVAFIPRHGSKHSIAPHKINYRANIWAMKKIGIKQILATTAVGSLNSKMAPGDFVLIDQFIDFTKNRINTFYDTENSGVVHIDVTEPYCPALRDKITAAALTEQISLHCSGTYVCTEGPRFETPAEIKMFAKLGGDLVGMTNVPEVTLAREAEICYATISMVTNFAAGISTQPLTHAEVVDTMRNNSEKIRRLLMKTVELIGENNCSCQQALQEYGGFKLKLD